MAKAQKIEALKQRIKTLEADIAEFVNIQNELGKVRLVSSKKSGLTGAGSLNNKTHFHSDNANSTLMLNTLDTLTEDSH